VDILATLLRVNRLEREEIHDWASRPFFAHFTLHRDWKYQNPEVLHVKTIGSDMLPMVIPVEETMPCGGSGGY
jgi:hypothetical protein